MKPKSEAQRQAMMASIMERAKHFQKNGFTGYSVSMRKKVDVKPSDKIEVKQTKLKNGNTSVMLMGHMKVDGKEIKVPRIVGQF